FQILNDVVMVDFATIDGLNNRPTNLTSYERCVFFFKFVTFYYQPSIWYFLITSLPLLKKQYKTIA
ncbi:hypothetical protein DKU15_22380, partial [Salmonella enterica subsp. houtenae]|nr:hypothetical protein [Salmonella enterica subsp. houtenae]